MDDFNAHVKDRNDPTSVRELEAAIVQGEREGRPIFHAADVVVPRLKQVAVARHRGGYALIGTAEEKHNRRDGRGSFLLPETAVYLDAPSRESARLLTGKPRAVAQMRFLVAAALHDIYGWPLEHDRTAPADYRERVPGGPVYDPSAKSVSGHLSYGMRYLDGARPRPPCTEDEDRLSYCNDDGRSARRAVEKGRALWAKLSAWPWWSLGALDGYRLPDDWRSQTQVVLDFAAWRDPQAFLQTHGRRSSGVGSHRGFHQLRVSYQPPPLFVCACGKQYRTSNPTRDPVCGACASDLQQRRC